MERPGQQFGSSASSARAHLIKVLAKSPDNGGSGPREQFTEEASRGFPPYARANSVVIASKFSFDIDPATCEVRGLSSRPEHIRRTVEGSLKHLGIEIIDLLDRHRADPNVPIEDVAATVRDLIAEGKARHFDMSEPGVETLRRAYSV